MLDSLLSSLITAPTCKKLSMLVVIYTRILCGDVKVVTLATASKPVCSQNGRMIKAVSQMNPVRSLTGNYMLRLHRDRAYSSVHGITSQKRLITILTTLRTSDLLEENSCVCYLIICFLENGDTKLVMRGHKGCRPPPHTSSWQILWTDSDTIWDECRIVRGHSMLELLISYNLY
jgi:hypothetical protein